MQMRILLFLMAFSIHFLNEGNIYWNVIKESSQKIMYFLFILKQLSIFYNLVTF